MQPTRKRGGGSPGGSGDPSLGARAWWRAYRAARRFAERPTGTREAAGLVVLGVVALLAGFDQLGLGPADPTPVLCLAVVAAGFVAGLPRSALAIALALAYGAQQLLGSAADAHVAVALWQVGGLAPTTGALLRELDRRGRRRSAARERQRLRNPAGSAGGVPVPVDFSEALNALVWEIDPETERVTSINRYAQTLLGHATERFLSEPGFHLTVIHPDDRAAVREARRSVARDGQPRQVEYRLVGRDGWEVWVRDSISLAPDSREAGARVRGVAVNISDQKRTEEELRLEKRRYQELVDGVPVGIYRITPEGRYLAANTALLEMMGHRTLEALASVEPGADPLDPLARWRWHDALLHRGGVRNFEIPCRRADGTMIWVRNTAKAVCDDAGEVLYYEGVMEDITDRKLAQEAERTAQARFRGLVEQSLVGIYILQNDRLVYVNPKLAEMFGYEANEMLALASALELVAPAYRRRFQEYIERGLATGTGESLTFTGRRRDGSEIDVEIHSSRTDFGNSPAVLATVLDITARKRAEERLHTLAFHDQLTGLPNRILFMERLGRALNRAQRGTRFAVLFLDLNRFKVVNDSLGHPIGDELLRVVARRLEECMRPGDTVARFGGDEFAILLEELTDPAIASQVAQRIQSHLAAPIQVQGYTLYTGASIGIAVCHDGSEPAEHILRSADMAMYRAKRAGGGRFEVFDRAMHEDAIVQLQLETDIRHAVEHGEFCLHYQPITCLETGKMEAVEALVRWQHRERGLVSPATFIPLAEEMGLITPIGQWVLRSACEQLREWQQNAGEGTPTSVSINISAAQFLQSSLVDDVEEAIRATGVDPRGLRLEITESILLKDQEFARTALARVKNLGVKIYLDDFGTGYSNLSYLHHLPLDVLKIDRSFINQLRPDGAGIGLVRTIVNLAQNLGVGVIAEGIETEEQLALLRQLGCQYGQGFLFSPPRRAEEIAGSGDDGRIISLSARTRRLPLDRAV